MSSSSVAAQGWRYARRGPIAKVLKLENFTAALAPVKGKGDLAHHSNKVLVKMHKAPMHRVDSAIVNGSALGYKKLFNSTYEVGEFPRVGGSEGVGTVVAVPSSGLHGNCKLKEGDLVWICPAHGTWASHVAVHGNMCHVIDKKHANLAVHATSLILAQHLLENVTTLHKGATVVQNGGTSFTSLAISALGKKRGLNVITAATPGTKRFAAAADRHKKFGSTFVEYSSKGARSLSKGAAPDLFLNGVGGRAFNDFLKVLGKNAHVCSFGAQKGPGLLFAPSHQIYNQLTMTGVLMPVLLQKMPQEERQMRLEFALNAASEAGGKDLLASYPEVTANGLEKMSEVWDDMYVNGGKKGVLTISAL